MGTKKGMARKGKIAGSRKAYDDTPDSKKRPSAAASRKKGVTTKKGMARKGTVAGSRLAYDDTKQEKEKIKGASHDRQMTSMWNAGEFWVANARHLLRKGGLSKSGAMEILDIIDNDPVNRYFMGKD